MPSPHFSLWQVELQPSPETVLPSSHCSPSEVCTMPSLHFSSLHALAAVLVAAGGCRCRRRTARRARVAGCRRHRTRIVQVELQTSPEASLPSSHCSPSAGSTMPSPQARSDTSSAAVSSVTALPSSQCSPSSICTMPSPCRTRAGRSRCSRRPRPCCRRRIARRGPVARCRRRRTRAGHKCRAAAVAGHRVAVVALLDAGFDEAVAAGRELAIEEAGAGVAVRAAVVALLAGLDDAVAAPLELARRAAAVARDGVAVVALLDARFDEAVAAGRVHAIEEARAGVAVRAAVVALLARIEVAVAAPRRGFD